MNETTDNAALQPDDYDALEGILNDLRVQDEGVPQWEFCEGFMAALICCRRLIMPGEYLPVLLGEAKFADETQAGRFMTLWMRRWNEVASALNDQDVEALDDARCYHPEVLDVRGAVAALPAEQRATWSDGPLPSYGQIWAFGFLSAVDAWSEEWAPPRDEESAEWLADALSTIEVLAGDDTGEPEVSALSDDAPPSISAARVAAFGDAIWAVYDLRELWRSVGPRVETVRKEATPGRNDLCPCGSGKKYKKCHGAN